MDSEEDDEVRKQWTSSIRFKYEMNTDVNILCQLIKKIDPIYSVFKLSFELTHPVISSSELIIINDYCKQIEFSNTNSCTKSGK